jgi:crossover junction endodeoxyribonuclease RuvC
MKIIGIDPGFERCGYGILEENAGDFLLRDFGTIRTNAGDPFLLRQSEIAQDFQFLLEKYQPDILSIEDLFFVKNVTTGMKVAHVRGVLLYLAEKFGCRVVEPKPVEVKQGFCGSGRADKKAICQMVQVMFGLENQPKIDDAADAIAVGVVGSRMQ